jgi:hypothetical protein
VSTLGASFSTTALDLIHRADMVCVLLDQDVSPNVYFELGYAAGQGRPIAIIGDKPRNLGEFPEAFWIRAALQDRTALSFQLRAFVENFQEISHREIVKPTPRRAKTTRRLKSSGDPQGLERDLLTLLEASPEIQSVVSQPRTGDAGYIPDFAVWFTTPSRIVESPVLIEVIGNHHGSAFIDGAVQRLLQFLRPSEVRTGLVIGGGQGLASTRVASLSPLIFVLSFEEAGELLRQGNLIETLHRERNRYAHSAG